MAIGGESQLKSISKIMKKLAAEIISFGMKLKWRGRRNAEENEEKAGLAKCGNLEEKVSMAKRWRETERSIGREIIS
jgi:hypothetical protein